MMDSNEIRNNLYGGKYQDPEFKNLADRLSALWFVIRRGIIPNELGWYRYGYHPKRMLENREAYDDVKFGGEKAAVLERIGVRENEFLVCMPLWKLMWMRLTRRAFFNGESIDSTTWVTCQKCGHRISDAITSSTLTRCPHCGAGYYTEFRIYYIPNPPAKGEV